MYWEEPHMMKWGFAARLIGSLLGAGAGCAGVALIYMWLNGLL